MSAPVAGLATRIASGVVLAVLAAAYILGSFIALLYGVGTFLVALAGGDALHALLGLLVASLPLLPIALLEVLEGGREGEEEGEWVEL